MASSTEKTLPPGNSPIIKRDALAANQDLWINLNDKPVLTNNISDYINKAILHNQQILQPNNSQLAPPQNIQQGSSLETAPATLNPVNLSSIENITKSPELNVSEIGSSGFSIKSPAGSPEWNKQLSNRIRWMGNLKISSAELKLHPAELGTIEIKISTSS